MVARKAERVKSRMDTIWTPARVQALRCGHKSLMEHYLAA